MRSHLLSSSEECGHTEDEERAPTGTWVMGEVRLAVEKGYRTLEIYEFTSIRSPNTIPETGEGFYSRTT